LPQPSSRYIPHAFSRTTVTTIETTIDPIRPRPFEKKKNMSAPGGKRAALRIGSRGPDTRQTRAGAVAAALIGCAASDATVP